MEYCRSLKFESRPNYSYLKGLFKTLFNENGFKEDNVFDWTDKMPDKEEGASVSKPSPEEDMSDGGNTESAESKEPGNSTEKRRQSGNGNEDGDKAKDQGKNFKKEDTFGSGNVEGAAANDPGSSKEENMPGSGNVEGAEATDS